VLHYEVTETFVNRGSGIGEADYLFPLPKGAAFQDLKLSINGELVSGEALNAAEARQIYEQIVRQRREPALGECEPLAPMLLDGAVREVERVRAGLP